ncbi:MAG: NUDIX hydrolase [Gemmatimonadetes bacterium]|nr:NUDIX hydrolase [Gemmatimonadota bacterium]
MPDFDPLEPPESNPPDWAVTYEASRFAPWSLTVDIVGFAHEPTTQDLHVVIVERGQPGPFQGYEAWPGGFVNWQHDVDARAAALRELEEETGQIHPEYLQELRTYDQFGRDPRQFSGYRKKANGEWIRTGTRVVSKAFLALLRKPGRHLQPVLGGDAADSRWASAYVYLPWEDVRSKASRATLQRLERDLLAWAEAGIGTQRAERRDRVERFFSMRTWNEEEARQRWDLVLEAKLVEEAWRDRWGRPRSDAPRMLYGEALAFDHRTMLADALATLRTEIKRQPEMPHSFIGSEFRLSELQVLFESVAGRPLYRSNFRRAIALSPTSSLVQPTGRKEKLSGPGKPADLYDFTPELLRTRCTPGLNLPWLPLEP